MAEIGIYAIWERWELNGARVATILTHMEVPPVFLQRHWQQAEPDPSITCPKCGMTSYHPEDIRYGYCGACSDYTQPTDP
jgi:hypothetical protein